MPHVIIKMYPGRDEETKKRLALKIEEDMINILPTTSDAISISIEEVSKDDWEEKVNKPDILSKPEFLYKESTD